ncbi:hypothetical protein ACJO2E_08630 [Marinobacter sp. M1N3S26]|uniref:hypothetical protein n=1 Tax=Marinobacter sp. M1N3S26 TaxID=3382299 RepID=UPI00387B0FDC
MLKPLIAMLLVVALASCAVLEEVEKNPMTAQLMTDQLTLRLIAADDDPVARAGRVREAVANLQARVDGGAEFTLEQFQEYALEEIGIDSLNQADRELVLYGVRLARQSIAELIGEGVVAPDERYTLATFLSWIDQAAARVR